MAHKHTNPLSDESSPYLLQHAHNPVNWHPWSQAALEKAEAEGKLLIISIGYAACHWCHVMEKECFEDEEVAEVMNSDFISIKVDREERPDIDQIYMDALQIMTGAGGWPLNVVALPDGRPFWGATYLRKTDWIQVLKQLATLNREQPQKIEEYADNMVAGLKEINQVKSQPEAPLLSAKELEDAVERWSRSLDRNWGGYNRAPKFMMPVNLDFLMRYAVQRDDQKLLEYVHTTLEKMAYGGLYDQLGGGFSRYSVDDRWHVPHFEKMLYDNAQLISLYAKAYALSGRELYREITEGCIDFVQKELMSAEFGFYSSLDADSENAEGILEEGAYYTWNENELKSILGPDYDIFAEYYNVNDFGHWEEGKYVLIRKQHHDVLASKFQLTEGELKGVISKCNEKLLEHRNRRPRPRLDDKILASWNGLMLRALVDAYRYLGKDACLEMALKNAGFLEKQMITEEGRLYHNYKEGKSSINGYLEDYASIIDAFFGLYEASLDERWLMLGKKLLAYTLEEFYDSNSGMFFFTSRQDPALVRRTVEVSDNVIPASNSIMARNLFHFSLMFPESVYGEKARQMISNLQEQIEKYPQNHANWIHLILNFQEIFFEVAISGSQAKSLSRELQRHYLPQAVFAASYNPSTLPLLVNRYKQDESLIYICRHGSCKLPVRNVDEAIELLWENRE